MVPEATLLLNRRDVASLLAPQDYLELVVGVAETYAGRPFNFFES